MNNKRKIVAGALVIPMLSSGFIAFNINDNVVKAETNTWC